MSPILPCRWTPRKYLPRSGRKSPPAQPSRSMGCRRGAGRLSGFTGKRRCCRLRKLGNLAEVVRAVIRDEKPSGKSDNAATSAPWVGRARVGMARGQGMTGQRGGPFRPLPGPQSGRAAAAFARRTSCSAWPCSAWPSRCASRPFCRPVLREASAMRPRRPRFPRERPSFVRTPPVQARPMPCLFRRWPSGCAFPLPRLLVRS